MNDRQKEVSDLELQTKTSSITDLRQSKSSVIVSCVILPLIILLLAGISLVILEISLADNEYKVLGTNSVMNLGKQGLDAQGLKSVLSQYIKESSENAEFFIKVKKITQFLGLFLIILVGWTLGGLGYIYYLKKKKS
jgi:hypothetical protein